MSSENKEEESTKLKRSLKATNIQELEVEMKLYVDECTRLRHMLEESYKNSMDPNEIAKMQEQFQIQENYIINLQNENQELAETCAKMQQIMQSQQEDREVENKLRSKLSKILTNKKKLSKNLKLKEKELLQLKKDLADARQSSKGGSSAVKTLNDRLNKFQKDLEDKNRTIAKLRKDLDDKNDVISRLQLEAGSNKNGGKTYAAQPREEAKTESPHKTASARAEQPETHEVREDTHDSQDPADDQDGHDDDDGYSDDKDQIDQRELNIIEDDHDEGNKNEEVKGELKAIISDIEVDPLFDKLKLCFQRNNIKYNNMSQILPGEITIMKLEHKLKSVGFKDVEERLSICRYIIEPRNEKLIEFNENREISKEKAENILKSKIEDYRTYEFDEDEFQKRVRDQIGRFKSTVTDALECEDLDGTGFIPAKSLKSCFNAMDINLDPDLIDYLVYISGVTDKVGNSSNLMIEYNKIVEMLDKNVMKEESKDAEKLLNKETENDYSDDYGNDFEDQHKQPQTTEPKDTEQQLQEAEGEDLDQEIDDEEMISIAENCLIKIAEELLNKKITIRKLYKDDIIDEEIEGEKIELLLPLSFLEGLKRLEINDFSQLEIACLMNVLAKPQLENTILLDELIDIMENLGIPDDDMEHSMGDHQQENADVNESPEPVSEKQTNKNKKKGMDLASLSDDAKTLLLNFLVYLESESMTAGNFFKSVKYEQMVKTKKKQSSVDIVPAEDFFRLLEETYEVVSDVNLTDEVKLELQDLL